MKKAALLLVLLAGCTSPVSEPGTAVEETTPAATTPAALSSDQVLFQGTGCQAAVLAILAEESETDPWLPPGFHPQDASHIIPIDVALGQTAWILVTIKCAETNVTDSGFHIVSLGAYVQRPDVDAESPASRFDFYELHRFALEGGDLPMLADWGWEVEPLGAQNLQVMVDQDTPAVEPIHLRPTLMTADAATDQQLFQFNVAAGTQLLVADRYVRFWRMLPEGVALLELVPDTDGAGGIATCALAPDTPFSRITGHALCEPGSALGGAFPVETFQGSYRYFRGTVPG